MGCELKKEERAKLKAVKEAIGNLTGLKIPYNIIIQNIMPFIVWIDKLLEEA